MKQAVIKAGGKQYLVSEGQVLDVELQGDAKKLNFEPLLVIDGKAIQVGTPVVKAVKVNAELVEEVKGDKVRVLKFQAKKRVHKLTGHRQKYSRVKITSIGK